MIIDRYLTRQTISPFIGVSVVLLTIFMAFSLSRYLIDAKAGLLGSAEVAQLAGLKALIATEVLIPIGLYIGLMIGLGRLHSDSEIYALKAGGVSETRLLRPIFLLSLVLATLIGVQSVFVRPWAYAESYSVQARAAASSELDRIRASQFYISSDENKASGMTTDKVIFVEKIAKNGKDLEGIFVRTLSNDELQVISSPTGVFESYALPDAHRVTMNDAHIYRKRNDGPDFFAALGSFSFWINIKKPVPPQYRAKSAATMDLLFSDDANDRAELQWRLSTPLSTLLLALLAVPLSRSRPRQGRYAKMLLALIVYAVYFNMLGVARTWVEQQSAQDIWWVPLILLLIVLVLYAPWSQLRAKRHH